MNEDSAKQRRLLELQVERWTAEAKKLAEAGKEGSALELYCQAADELPGAPWLQHRTAELARKLKQHDLAISYFRRAATAFQIADFTKRAVAPLRTAWTLAVDGLPTTSKALVDVAVELMQLHRRLGFAADATVTFERTNAALRTRGFSEIAPHVLDSLPRGSARSSGSPGAESGSPAPRASEVVARGPGSSPAEASAHSRSHSAALFGRR